MLRSLAIAGVLAAVAACQPDLPFTPPTTSIVTAVFDPTTSRIPLPNDLVFLSGNLNSVCPSPGAAGAPPACAQAELLASFAGRFPNDQAVPITIEFNQTNFVNGSTTDAAPDLDLATFTPANFFVMSLEGTPAEVELDPLTPASYVMGTDRGTLTVHRRGRQPWTAGATYAVLLRGGPQGVKTKTGIPVSASTVFHLIAQGEDLTARENIGLLRAQTGSLEAARAQAQQLNLLIAQYRGSAFVAADTKFPHEELAIAATFRIKTETNVPIDPARSQVPLPIDLLRGTNGRLTPLAACTLAGAQLAPDGSCASPAAAGFLALDGFSTTGAILAPPSVPVRAATITPTSLRLYDLSNPAQPVQVDPASLVIAPCEFNVGGCAAQGTVLAPVIAIQPAGATAGDPTSPFRSRPLKDATDYAVVITTDVLDMNGSALGRGTVASVLGFTNPIVVNGRSALLGIDDATAASLEKMRLQLQPVFTTLAAGGVAKSRVAMAYTFRTQTILSQAVQLGALPYTTAPATALPIAASFVAQSADAAFTKFGVDKARIPGELAGDNIDEILEVDITTFNALDPLTGAFLANPAQAVPETIKVLIATPKAANVNVPACAGPLAAFGKCAPLMVFRHGLTSGRLDMLTVADSYAKAGMVTVAIDAAKHGDRSFCTGGATGAASGCVSGTCVSPLPPGAQGDVNPPGSCGAQGFIKRPLNAGVTGNTDGIPVVSGNYLISANFFRTRDSMRQDLIDQSQLIRALAFAPAGPGQTGHVVFDHILARAVAQTGAGMIIDPNTVYYSGQSLGALQGVMNVATNPRISKAGFNVGGGTIVDIFTNSPAFAAQVGQLLQGLGITPGTRQFLQFLVVGKTVLDPADPINYAGHLTASTLPNLLPPLGGNPNGSVAQAPKKILSQVANCDTVIPNPFSLVYSANVPTGPLPTGAAFFAPGATGTFQLFVGADFNPAAFGTCATGAAAHTVLTNWAIPTLTTKAQDDIANFVRSDVLPPSVQRP